LTTSIIKGGDMGVEGQLTKEMMGSNLPVEMPGPSVMLRPVAYPDKPVQMDLIRIDSVWKPTRMHAATGSCSFTGISVVDPWHTIPLKEMLGASYFEGELCFSGGETLETF
jgi:hypothetical protein